MEIGMTSCSPQDEALQDIIILPLVAVTQPGAIATYADAKRPFPLNILWLEVVLHVGYNPIHRIPIEEQERIIVRYTV